MCLFSTDTNRHRRETGRNTIVMGTQFYRTTKAE